MTILGVPRFSAVWMFLAVGAFAINAKAETLDAAVQSALQHHPSIDSARASIDAAGEEKREEFSGYFPEISASTTGGRIYGDNSTSRGLSVTRGAGYSYLWEGSLTARQMIFDGFGTPNRVQAAAARKLSAEMNLLDVRENLSLRATQAYLNVLRARTGLALIKKHDALVEDYLGRIKTSVDEGVADDAEYQQARDVKVILQGFVSDYEGQVRAAEADYFEVTGRLPDGEMTLPQPQLDLMAETVEQALEIAKDSHPSLRSAMFLSHSAERDIDSEQAQLFPEVNGELSYLKSDKADIIGGELVDERAVVRMNWNFETGGAQLARIKRKKYEYQEAQARVNELQRQIERGVKLAYSELQTAQNQMDLNGKREELNTKLFDTYKVQFEGARITLLQLMQADNQLFNTRLEKMNAEYRVLAARYAVLASMGRLQGSLNLASSDTTGPQSHEQK